jgi:hypothetical protein
LQQGLTTVNGKLDYSKIKATFTLKNVLAAQTKYTANVSIGGGTDLCNEPDAFTSFLI